MSIAQAAELMLNFAERTGLTSERAADRYLWTDAFAVCNFLGLAQATGETHHLERAARLVEGVHHVLGRHRDDDPRQGWLSGLSEAEGEAHPTRGGLRIGKPRPERRVNESFDQRLEWERDGQYFHYLTKWMHALDVMGRVTGDVVFNRWARELAQIAHAKFVYMPSGQRRPRMYWKMSIDLSRPLVASMGHHDPLDGYVIVEQLPASQASHATAASRQEGPTLDEERASFAQMVVGRDWTTTDPLGLGGLLIDAARLGFCVQAGGSGDDALLSNIITCAHEGLERYAASRQLEQPPEHRLAFRELGLAIGLSGVEPMLAEEFFTENAAPEMSALGALLPLRDQIVGFWQQPENRKGRAWAEHRNINDVMLATALAPQGLYAL